MKAMIYKRYGSPDVLQLKEVPTPTPKDNEIQIKIQHSTVTASDCEMRRFDFPRYFWLPLRLYMGLTKPKKSNRILGFEIAGKVEAVGKSVTKFQVGDRVLTQTGLGFGAYAEYKCMKEDSMIVKIPDDLTNEEVVPLGVGGMNALHYIRKCQLQSGQKLLINGAAGSFGSYAIPLAKMMGVEVTAVDTSEKFDVLQQLGADHLVDYQQEDFSESGIKYDAILDIACRNSFNRSIKSLKSDGTYVIANPRTIAMMWKGFWIQRTSKKTITFEFANDNIEDLQYLVDLIHQGKIKTHIDKIFPFEQLADAHRHIESPQRKGHTLVLMSE